MAGGTSGNDSHLISPLDPRNWKHPTQRQRTERFSSLGPWKRAAHRTISSSCRHADLGLTSRTKTKATHRSKSHLIPSCRNVLGQGELPLTLPLDASQRCATGTARHIPNDPLSQPCIDQRSTPSYVAALNRVELALCIYPHLHVLKLLVCRRLAICLTIFNSHSSVLTRRLRQSGAYARGWPHFPCQRRCTRLTSASATGPSSLFVQALRGRRR